MTVNAFVVESPNGFERLKPVKIEPRLLIAGDILDAMLPIDHPRVTREPDGLVLIPTSPPNPYLKSKGTFSPPLVIRTRAKTNAREIRLYCGGGLVILNWEDNPSELRVHDILTGQPIGVPGRGLIRPNQWHDIVWTISDTGMTLSVDGFVRFQNRANYRSLNAWVGIGPAWSKVTVDYFSVLKQ